MKKTLLFLAIGLIGTSLLVACGSKTQNTSNNQNTTQIEQAKNNNKSDNKTFYKSGFYEVGKDLPAGEYLILQDKSNAVAETSVAISTDSKKENELFAESIAGNTYANLEKGEYLEVTNGNIYPIDIAPSNTPKDKVYKDGMYKVGKDIKAGTYDVKALKDSASIEITKDSSHKDSSIISKKDIKNTEKVTLKDGEYITLNNAEITVK